MFEALIGAIFIDGGFENVEGFVVRYWEDLAKSSICSPEDPKTALQEWTQKLYLPLRVQIYVSLQSHGVIAINIIVLIVVW